MKTGCNLAQEKPLNLNNNFSIDSLTILMAGRIFLVH